MRPALLPQQYSAIPGVCCREYRRQLAAFSQMVAGEAVIGEMALYRRRANAADHRSGVGEHAPHGAGRGGHIELFLDFDHVLFRGMVT